MDGSLHREISLRVFRKGTKKSQRQRVLSKGEALDVFTDENIRPRGRKSIFMLMGG